MADADLDALADELYTLPPDQFVDARAAVVAAARDAGHPTAAAAVAKLRKPTVTAFLANQVVRSAPDVVAGVIAVGPAMREATATGDAAALRDLGRHRATLLGDLVGRARAIAEEHDVRFTATNQRELEATFSAAAVDELAAATLLTGRIVGPLETAGLGFDLGGLPAAGSAPTPSRPADADAEEEAAPARLSVAQVRAAERERAVTEAEQALAEARLQDADAEAALAAAQAAFDEAQAQEAAAAEALRLAKAAVSDARADLTAAKADATATGRAVAAALAALERASRR